MAYNYPSPDFFYFGTGSDGDVTLTTSSDTTGPVVSGMLQRDAYFNNLTISGSGQLKVGGYKLYVRGTLDISGATGVAISLGTGSNGTNATGSAAVSSQSGIQKTSHGVFQNNGPNSGAGQITNGSAGQALPQVSAYWCGNSGAAGKGGNASIYTGGAGGVATSTRYPYVANYFSPYYLGTIGQGPGNIASLAGGGGAGSNVAGQAGGAGGGGAHSGGLIWISAYAINRSSSNAVGAIQNNGFNGGNGFTPTVGNCGGGGGAGGNGGGIVMIFFNKLLGSTATNLIQVDGGNGGNGGNGVGTGLGGDGGGGGGAGSVFYQNLQTGAYYSVLPGDGTASVAGSGITGGTGAAGVQRRVSL